MLIDRPAARIAALSLVLASGGVTAQYLPYGTGCPGSQGPFELIEPFSRAVAAGRNFRFRAGPLPAGAPASLLIGFVKRFPGIDLSAIGMTGCSLYHSVDIAEPMASSSGTASLLVPIPSAVRCASFYVQVAGFDAAANPLGVVTSDAATLVLDPVSRTVLHRGTSANTSRNSTFLDEPSINGEPHAIFGVTQAWNPPGSPGRYNPHEIGVWYDDTSGRWAVFNQDRTTMPVGASFHVLLPNSGAWQFTAKATPLNTTGDRIVLDHQSLNGNAYRTPMVTQVWNPGGGGGVYNDHAIGTVYDRPTGRWQIFNQDGAAMPVGAAFHVIVADPNHTGGSASTHEATTASIVANRTFLDHAVLNGNPDATLTVTQVWNPGGRTFGVHNAHPIGVYYDQIVGRWAIFNEDLAAMPVAAAFHYVVGALLANSLRFVHRATANNSSAEITFLSHPDLDGEDRVHVFCTPVWNPNGRPGVYNDHPTGVYYEPLRSQWAVFNQDRAPMPAGASFNVLVPDTPARRLVLEATAANTSGHTVRITHPLIDGNPDARIFVEQLWSTPGRAGVYNDANIGAYYNQGPGQWEVFNQDLSAIALNTKFFVLIAEWHLDHRFEPIVHVGDASNTVGHITYIDHPELNGHPDAQLTVTQVWNPDGRAFGVYNDHAIGVYYDGNRQQWSIFNQDRQPMPPNAAFFVLIGSICR